MNTPQADPTARLTATLLLSGALLLIVGNVSHPVDGVPSATSRFALASGDMWVIVHLVLATGFAVVAAGLVTVRASLTRPAARALARIGAIAAGIGGTLMFAVFGGLDGYAVSSLAPRWQAASETDRPALEAAAATLEAIDTGLAAVGTLALLGFALVAIGTALFTGGVVPRWLGLAGIVLGLLGTVTGVVMALDGATEFTINVLLRPLGMTSTFWFVAVGIGFWRLSPATAPSVPRPTTGSRPRRAPAP